MKTAAFLAGMALLVAYEAQAEQVDTQIAKNQARKLRFLGLFSPPEEVDGPEALDMDEMYTPEALDMDENAAFQARKLRFLGLFSPPEEVDGPEALDMDEMYTPEALDMDEN